ncbi:MAG: diacylglycerol kinase family lipid kinase [Acidobacteria bacterium]|nr:diacylglycerol kinase family lipid kinase [Acidobacteriota bacterium]MCA1638923.1 diacylglycerol kinase family lipid kinase [Acidobacteriota bacterium]
MPTPINIIINAASGTSNKEDERQILADIFEANGVDAQINLAQSGAEIVEMAKRAARGNSEIIVAGGGDGTISAVASELVGTEKILGVLPLGTLNHFAKDLNIPLDLEEAARTIIAGVVAKVDVGEVNGQVFINNSSLGLYPEVVRRREQRQRLGYGKWNSLVRAAFQVLRRYPFLNIRLNTDGEEIITRTPFVFVGNNTYEMESFNIGGRTCLDAGHLSLYMTPRAGRFELLQMALRALFGNLRQAKDFVSLCTDEVWIETRRRQMRVAMDGEVLMLQMPLHYRVRPAALSVIVPAKTEDETSE